MAERYNEIRPHDALGSLPPARYREHLLGYEDVVWTDVTGTGSTDGEGATVPESGTLALLGINLFVLGLARRRQTRRYGLS